MKNDKIAVKGELSDSTPPSGSVQAQLDTQRIQLQEMKDELDSKAQSADTVTENLQVQVESQQVEIDQLTDDVASNKKSAEESTEILQTQVAMQQVEITQLSDALADQEKIVEALGGNTLDEQKQAGYVDYLKAAAEDLGDQFNREREAHSRTQQELLNASNPPQLLSSKLAG
ncbi:hypothetical protein BH10PLA1_BH10PLA1_14270 [soil metagenome]